MGPGKRGHLASPLAAVEHGEELLLKSIFKPTPQRHPPLKGKRSSV